MAKINKQIDKVERVTLSKTCFKLQTFLVDPIFSLMCMIFSKTRVDLTVSAMIY